jgi:putative ABC transport system permease protein
MLKNYLLTAWRNLIHGRVYSIINIAGLSLGLTCVMLIVLYVKDEVSYDRFHRGVENICRITVGVNDPLTGMRKFGITGFLQGPHFAAEIPGIESFVRVRKGHVDVQTKDGVQ